MQVSPAIQVQVIESTVTLVAAIVSAAIAVVSAFLAYVKERSVTAQKGRIDDALATKKADLEIAIAKQVEPLKAELNAGLETRKAELALELEGKLGPMRTDLAKQLAATEASLRVLSETRLRLFETAVTSLERVIRLAHVEVKAVYTMALKTKGVAVKLEREPGGQAFDEVGVFLPSDLDDAYDTLCKVIGECKFEGGRAALGDLGAEGPARAGKAADRARDALKLFELAARGWKKTHWTEFSGDKPQ